MALKLHLRPLSALSLVRASLERREPLKQGIDEWGDRRALRKDENGADRHQHQNNWQ